MVRQRRARGLAAEEYGYPRHSKNDKPHAREHPKVEPRRTALLIFGLLQRHHIHEGTLAAMLLGRSRIGQITAGGPVVRVRRRRVWGSGPGGVGAAPLPGAEPQSAAALSASMTQIARSMRRHIAAASA
jgi:hypothetical protein